MKKYALLMGLGLLAASATAQTALPSDLFGRNVNQFGLGSVWAAKGPMASPGNERDYVLLPTPLGLVTMDSGLRPMAAPSGIPVPAKWNIFQWLVKTAYGRAVSAPGQTLFAVTGSADAPAIASLAAPLDFQRLGFEQPGFGQFHWPAAKDSADRNGITEVASSPVTSRDKIPAVASLTAPLDFRRLGFEQPGFEQFHWPAGDTLAYSKQKLEVVASATSPSISGGVAAPRRAQDSGLAWPSTSLYSPLALLQQRFDAPGSPAEPLDTSLFPAEVAEVADMPAILPASSMLPSAALLPPARMDYFALTPNREGESRVAMEAPAEMHLRLSTAPHASAIAQQEPSQTQSGQPADQPNPPTNPLQTSEPPKPTDTNTTNAKATFSGGESSTTGKNQLLGEVRLMQRYSQINGDQTRSFRVPGSNRLAEFNIFTDNAFRFSRRIQSLFMYRGTDDRSIDPEHNSLQKAYVRFYGPRDETILGDSLVNYSRLSFNQNIKGLNFSTRLGDHWKLFAVGGIFIDRYGSLYNDLPGRPYRAAVAGARLEYRFLKDSTLGMNFSNSTDQIDSLPLQSAPGNPTGVGIPPLPADNRVYSVDSKIQLGGLRTDIELAYSQTDFDRRFFAGCPGKCDPRMPLPGFGFQNDLGFRLEETYRYKKLNVRGSYVRYEPNFASINARQIADLQDIVFRTGYDVTDWLTVDGTVRRSNNNLKQQLPFETTLWGPEARFLFHDLSLYRRATLEVGYRHRDVQASDKSIDRFVRIPYAEFSIPVSTTFFTIGYERRNSVDMRDAAQSSNTDRVYASLRGIYDVGGWHVTPTFRYELERQNHRPRLNSFPLANCLLTPFNVNCLLDRDSNRLGLASVFVEPPKYFIAELAFRDTSATIFGPSGYSRPSYRAQLTYKIRNDENTEFILGFERNSNFYFTSPDYDERIFSGTVLLKFGKRGQ